MEHIEKIKKAIKVIESIITLSMEESTPKRDVSKNLDFMKEEVTELEKILNYTNSFTASVKKEEPSKEMVNHPLHYQGLKVNDTNVECIDAMEGLKGWYNTAIFCALNAFKYNWRVGEKDMIPQELGKIAWYGDKAEELWNKALRWLYPKNGHKYAIVNQNIARMKNPTTGEWTDAIIYTDGIRFYVREASDFNSKFKLDK